MFVYLFNFIVIFQLYITVIFFSFTFPFLLWHVSKVFLINLNLNLNLYMTVYPLNKRHTLICDVVNGGSFVTSSTPGGILNLVQFPAASRKATDDVSWHDINRIFIFFSNGYLSTFVTLITLTMLAVLAKPQLRHPRPYSPVLKY